MRLNTSVEENKAHLEIQLSFLCVCFSEPTRLDKSVVHTELQLSSALFGRANAFGSEHKLVIFNCQSFVCFGSLFIFFKIGNKRMRRNGKEGIMGTTQINSASILVIAIWLLLCRDSVALCLSGIHHWNLLPFKEDSKKHEPKVDLWFCGDNLPQIADYNGVFILTLEAITKFSNVEDQLLIKSLRRSRRVRISLEHPRNAEITQPSWAIRVLIISSHDSCQGMSGKRLVIQWTIEMLGRNNNCRDFVG